MRIDGLPSGTKQAFDAIQQRATDLAVISKVYTSESSGRYLVDAKSIGPSGQKYKEIEVGRNGAGEVRGVAKGDLVGIKQESGAEDSAVVDSVFYNQDQPFVETQEGDIRNRFGNSTIEIVDQKIIIGTSGGRGEIASGILMDLEEGSIFLGDGSNSGVTGDGEGNFVWNYRTMSMPATGGGGMGSSTPQTETPDDQQDATGGWTEGAFLPEAVAGNTRSGAVVNGELHSFGGFGQDGTPVNTHYIYNPTEDTWREGTPLPNAISGATAVATDNSIYVIGGDEGLQNYSNAVYSFSGGSFQQVGTTPQDGLHGASGVYDAQTNQIYVVGGDGRNLIWTFDPETNEVSNNEWARLPQQARWTSAHIVGRQMYVFGGENAGSMSVSYNLDTGEQQQVAEPPEPMQKTAGDQAVLEGKIHATHGRFNNQEKPTHAIFDTETGEWSQNVPSIAQGNARNSGASGVVKGKLYVAGGDSNSQATTSVDVYTPGASTEESTQENTNTQ